MNIQKLAEAIETHGGVDRVGATELAELIVAGQKMIAEAASELTGNCDLWLRMTESQRRAYLSAEPTPRRRGSHEPRVRPM